MTLPTHKPVLLQEAIEALQAQPRKRYVDCTLGCGGHAQAILERIQPGGKLLGIDTDPEAMRVARVRLSNYAESTTMVNDNFVNLETICKENNFLPVQGILFDLGISSAQIEEAWRGFSFQQDGPLDMRFSPTQELTAADIINILTEDKLAELIRNYGEERYSRQIAKHIARHRPVATTLGLANIIERAVGGRRSRIHPATRTFMALRIATNRELESLITALKQAVTCLDHKGRLVVISYHSLEDRLVKNFMKQESTGCLCPPGTPKCTCGHEPTLKLISKKVITPSPKEIESNTRSRSAKLRVAERL
ncbi:MAG: 16S rRNA (cytosine(1402)-N(4))-methyltransferase RsmH [Chloroflexota bacterium]|nr:MAG: 16S rRNA (cytosine(1402)-N(4))-methyltransferase RsmH [Chloroflexota bacterium]